MDAKQDGDTKIQPKCKFLVTETIQGIVHGFCQNQVMLENNKPESDGRLVCMGNNCGNASFDTLKKA
jgi:hypothetical protein